MSSKPSVVKRTVNKTATYVFVVPGTCERDESLRTYWHVPGTCGVTLDFLLLYVAYLDDSRPGRRGSELMTHSYIHTWCCMLKWYGYGYWAVLLQFKPDRHYYYYYYYMYVRILSHTTGSEFLCIKIPGTWYTLKLYTTSIVITPIFQNYSERHSTTAPAHGPFSLPAFQLEERSPIA